MCRNDADESGILPKGKMLEMTRRAGLCGMHPLDDDRVGVTTWMQIWSAVHWQSNESSVRERVAVSAGSRNKKLSGGARCEEPPDPLQ